MSDHTHTATQTFAEQCASHCMGLTDEECHQLCCGEVAEVNGIQAIDVGALVELIMQLINDIIGSCPEQSTKFRAALKDPSRFAKSRFRNRAEQTLRGAFGGKFADDWWDVSECMMSCAAHCPEADVTAIINEVDSTNWLI